MFCFSVAAISNFVLRTPFQLPRPRFDNTRKIELNFYGKKKKDKHNLYFCLNTRASKRITSRYVASLLKAVNKL